MKQLLIFIKKEFLHVFRDTRTLLILFVMPVIQIILYGSALSNEVKNLNIVVWDNAHDINSQQIVDKISTNPYFHMKGAATSYESIDRAFKNGTAKCAIIFPINFGMDLSHAGKAQVQIIADASDPNTAKALVNYLTSIITEYQDQINQNSGKPYKITPEVRKLYNEEENGSLNFIPGVIALIFMIVCTTLTSVSVVKEKELGTMEVLLVSPFKPMMVLIAKTIPFLVLSLVNFVIILALSAFILDVEIKGSLLLLFAESTLFIITCLSLGLLISNSTSSQQVAMLISMMGMMLPTIILTGFLFPLENMPIGFQIASYILPSRYYYIIIKAVMLKGLGFSYIWKETLILIGMTLLLLVLALRNFKKRLQ